MTNGFANYKINYYILLYHVYLFMI